MPPSPRTIPSRELLSALDFSPASEADLDCIGKQFDFLSIGAAMLGIEILATTIYPSADCYECGSFALGSERGSRLANTLLLDVEARLRAWGLARKGPDELFATSSPLAPGSPVIASFVGDGKVKHFALSHIGDDGRLTAPLTPRWTSKLGRTRFVIRHSITNLASPSVRALSGVLRGAT